MPPERTVSTLSRRRFLGTAGAGIAAAMFSGAVLPAASGRVVIAQDGSMEFHAAWPYLDPGAGGHFNSFVTNGIIAPPNVYGDLMFTPMGLLYWGTNEWLPLVATDWAFIRSDAADTATPASGEGIDPLADTFQVTLREGVKWSNGNELTAQDIVDTFWCLRLMSNTVWEYIDDVTAVDDYTVDFHMSNPSTVVERYVVRMSPRPSVTYGEWAQKTRDLFESGKTLDDPEGKQLLDQFNQFRPEELVVSGPYTVDQASITNAEFLMPKNESSFWADQVAFDRIVNFNGETDTITAVVLSKEIDYATHGFAPATKREMVDLGIRVIRQPRYGGAALLFNFGKLPEMNDKRVRQAFAHIIDRDRVGEISLGEPGVGVKAMTGISDNQAALWMPEDRFDALDRYEPDVDKATALLEEAGWTKDGDFWKTSEGNDAVYEIVFPPEQSDHNAAAQDIAEQLTTFGIQVTPRGITHTQLPIDIDKGNFELAVRSWGSSTNPHPHYSFTVAFFNHNTLARNNGGEGMAFPLEQETEVAGHVNIEELVVASAEGLDEDAQKERVTTICEVFNELVSIIPMYERYVMSPALEGIRVEAWPPDDDVIYQNSPYADGIPTMLLYTGRLEPVEGGES